MKANLISIVDRKALPPGSGYWPDDDIKPTLTCRPVMMAASRTAMGNQTPEVVSIKTATNKPKALKVCQVIPFHVKANNSW
jgi:hypothetical protein